MGGTNDPGLNNTFTPVPRKGDHTYTVPLRDWSRLKNSVEQIPAGPNFWVIASSVLLGACLTFLGVALSPDITHKAPYWWLCVLTGFGFTLTTIFTVVTGRLVRAGKSQALDRIKEIEEDHQEVQDAVAVNKGRS